MPKKKKKAIVLLSGGMDSSVVLSIAKEQGYEVAALTFCYGQRHDVEIDAARKQVKHQGVSEHIIFNINLDVFGGSALTDNIEVPKGDRAPFSDPIPATYVPARNTVFLSIALAYAETIGAKDIFIGVSSVDYSGYPDCRPEFITAFEKLANIATRAVNTQEKYRIHAPLINLTKEETVLEGAKRNVQFGMTRTCYDPSEEGFPCGKCEACILRAKGFEKAHMEDPVTKLKNSKTT